MKLENKIYKTLYYYKILSISYVCRVFSQNLASERIMRRKCEQKICRAKSISAFFSTSSNIFITLLKASFFLFHRIHKKTKPGLICYTYCLSFSDKGELAINTLSSQKNRCWNVFPELKIDHWLGKKYLYNYLKYVH